MIRRLAAAAIALAASGAMAGGAPIVYQDRPLTDPLVKRLWGDAYAEVRDVGSSYEPYVLVAVVPVGSDRSLTISQLMSGGMCSARDCPVKIHDGDRLVAEDMLCAAGEMSDHFISDDRRHLTACDRIVSTNRR